MITNISDQYLYQYFTNIVDTWQTSEETLEIVKTQVPVELGVYVLGYLSIEIVSVTSPNPFPGPPTFLQWSDNSSSSDYTWTTPPSLSQWLCHLSIHQHIMFVPLEGKDRKTKNCNLAFAQGCGRGRGFLSFSFIIIRHFTIHGRLLQFEEDH